MTCHPTTIPSSSEAPPIPGRGTPPESMGWSMDKASDVFANPEVSPVGHIDTNLTVHGMLDTQGLPSTESISHEWEFNDELPDLQDETDQEDILDGQPETLDRGSGADTETPIEAQPFEDFALEQAGAARTMVSGLRVVVIVHRNGIHRLPVRWCRCRGHLGYELQALGAGCFPASYKQIRTLFTFEVLDDFLADNQECKSSAWHYFQKLRRFTCSSFPHTVPVSGC